MNIDFLIKYTINKHYQHKQFQHGTFRTAIYGLQAVNMNNFYLRLLFTVSFKESRLDSSSFVKPHLHCD